MRNLSAQVVPLTGIRHRPIILPIIFADSIPTILLIILAQSIPILPISWSTNVVNVQLDTKTMKLFLSKGFCKNISNLMSR